MISDSYCELFSIEGNSYKFIPVQTLNSSNQKVYAIIVIRDDELPSHYLMTPLEDLFWYDSLVTLIESIEWYFQNRHEKNEDTVPMKYSDIDGDFNQLQQVEIIGNHIQSLGEVSWETFNPNTYESRQRTSLSKAMSVCIKAIELNNLI